MFSDIYMYLITKNNLQITCLHFNSNLPETNALIVMALLDYKRDSKFGEHFVTFTIRPPYCGVSMYTSLVYGCFLPLLIVSLVRK